MSMQLQLCPPQWDRCMKRAPSQAQLCFYYQLWGDIVQVPSNIQEAAHSKPKVTLNYIWKKSITDLIPDSLEAQKPAGFYSSAGDCTDEFSPST